ncbi:mitochondrial matrix Mmp37 [Ochromonadaceae sp. CCMP2298]|nr:mitochondrial matrix Mmp37 [Ochromonadaceae sp. CCMP2298]
MLNDDDASQLLSHFPPVEFAFAYGSGVVEQSGYTYEHPAHLPMLDAVLVVDNPTQWHTDNMHQNPSHYSPLIPVGPRLVASFQERIPAHLWFNTYVPITSGRYAGRMMKYGIISKKDILMDLSSWSDLYTAGRLQKPVRILKGNAEIEGAMGLNLESAVRASLLMLPEVRTVHCTYFDC